MIFTKYIKYLFFLFASSYVFLFCFVQNLTAATVQLEGEVLPVAILEIDLPNARLSSEGQTSGVVDFGIANAMGVNSSPIGRVIHSPQFEEAYYQADITVRVQASGLTQPLSLVVKQNDQGPLAGLVYDADSSFDINQTRSLSPIPSDPLNQILINNIDSGTHEYFRQIIIRVTKDLEAGQKTALLEYKLEICQ